MLIEQRDKIKALSAIAAGVRPGRTVPITYSAMYNECKQDLDAFQDVLDKKLRGD